MKRISKILMLSLLIMLCAATAMFFLSCNKDETTSSGDSTGTTDTASTITITVEVVNSAGEHTDHVLTTSATTLADALLEAGFVEGPIEEYGLYITTVDGETADWNVDQSYWSLLQDGEYLMTGASDTVIHDGDHYELVYTKG